MDSDSDEEEVSTTSPVDGVHAVSPMALQEGDWIWEQWNTGDAFVRLVEIARLKVGKRGRGVVHCSGRREGVDTKYETLYRHRDIAWVKDE